MRQTSAPLIVQNDFTILLDTHTRDAEIVRTLIGQFSDLLRSPDHVHFYQISPLSLWNAAAAGVSLDAIMDTLSRYSRTNLPPAVVAGIADYIGRYGVLQLVSDDDRLVLRSRDEALLGWIVGQPRIKPFVRRARR